MKTVQAIKKGLHGQVYSHEQKHSMLRRDKEDTSRPELSF